MTELPVWLNGHSHSHNGQWHPQPLEGDPGSRPTLPPFPLDVLPDWARYHVDSVAADTQTDPALAATVALGAISAGLTVHHTVLHVDGAWTTHLNLYLLAIAESGEGKSPVFKAMTGPLEQLRVRHLAAQKTARDVADSEYRIIEKRLHAAETAVAKTPGDEAAKADLEDARQENARFEMPPIGNLMVDDITPEAFATELRDSGGVVIAVNDEASFLGTLSRYRAEGRNTNVQPLLKAWDGSSITVKRQSVDVVHVPTPWATICITTQPHYMKQLVATDEYADTGVTWRFMPCWPPTKIGHRDFVTTPPRDMHAQRLWDDEVGRLFDGAPDRLQLGDEARLELRHWNQALEDRTLAGERWLAPFRPKAYTSVIRLAAILHLADDTPGDEVGVGAVGDAIEVGEYWVAHMGALVAGDGFANDTAKVARKVLDWLGRHEELTEVSVRDLQRGPLKCRLEDAVPVVDLLIEKDWLRADSDAWATPRQGLYAPRLRVCPMPHLNRGE